MGFDVFDKIQFGKYRAKTNCTKVLMIYLLLGGYDLKKIKFFEEVEENRKFGLKIHKMYGVTEDYVNTQRIANEIESIINPVICSPQSFEYYCDSPIIHSYTAEDKDSPLWINDINVISKSMIISPKCVVSSNMASRNAAPGDRGFMYFYDYILKEECVIADKWHIRYKDKTFEIYYLTKDGTGQGINELLLYQAMEMDKSSTYKWVIYIIKQSASLVPEWTPDNFKEQTLELVVGNE